MKKTKKIDITKLKQSQLLRLAVKDAQACERSRLYKLSMGTWHTPNGKCAVCMAGAIMAKTLGVPRTRFSQPGLFEAEVERALHVVNRMRGGGFGPTSSYAGCACGECCDVSATPKEALAARRAARDLVAEAFDDRLGRAPWSVYLKAARILSKAGL